MKEKGRISRSPALRRWSQTLLAAGVSGAALAVGAIHTVTLCVVTAVLAAAAVLAWWDAEPMRVRPVATLLVVTGAVLTAYTVLQCVPLPAGLLAHIAPHNADVWARALAPLHEAGPRWAPISEDPIATRVEAMKGVAYLLAFVTALRVARTREGVALLGAVVVVTTLVLAAAALLHPAFGLKKLYGFYDPGPGIGERHIAPLMNPNNLAGYLNLGFCLALAAALSPEPRRLRALSAAAVVVLSATQVWVASRGGVIAMVLGGVVLVTVLRLVHGGERRGRVAIVSIVTGVVAVAGAALIVLGGSQDASDELLVSDVSKAKYFGLMMRCMAPSVPLFGCGRGAFESAYPAFRIDPGYVRFTHPENFVAQWLLEWGLPLGALGLLAVVYALRPAVVMARSVTAAGAWAALLALAVQNLADLGTEIPGLALGGVVCAAIVVAGTPGREARWRIERWSQSSRAVAIVAAVAAAGALLLAAPTVGRNVEDDRYALEDAALERHVPMPEMNALAHAAILRHPAEPYLPFITAVRAFAGHDVSPLPWIEATLERAKVYGPAHVLLARAVAARSPSQARLEYRLAMEQSPEQLGPIIDEAPRVVGGYDDAMELVPAGKAAVQVMEALAERIGGRLPATRVRLDEAIEARAPAEPRTRERLAQDTEDDLAAGDAAPWCAGEGRDACVQTALERAAALQALAPGKCEGWALQARARMAAGEIAKALTDLVRRADEVEDRVPCLEALAGMALDAHQSTVAEEAAEKVASAGCREDAECAANLTWVAGLEERMGNSRSALAFDKRAYDRTPGDDRLLEHIAALASGAGLHAEAAGDYEQLARRHPEDARWRTRMQAEREEALRGAAEL